MEITSNFKHSANTNSSPLNSPSTCNNNGNSNNNNNNNNNNNQPSLPITRSDPNSPYPTTFVTADTSSFKQVVQMLTGSSESNSPKPQQNQQQNQNQIKTMKLQGFKLYERRNSIKHLISPLTSANTAAASSPLHQTASFSPRYKQEILSPSLLDFPSLTLSPVTPLVEDPFDKSSPSKFGADSNSNGGTENGGPTSSSEEEKAIAEKGFFLHPSPISTPRDSQPQLLPLFPISSPRLSNLNFDFFFNLNFYFIIML
ncbi:VQ motif-containing protein 4 [Bienertia sinuspersici]